eukprot:TRINITY_DN2791_c0_g1_i2.p1 TRINITY_DN2791_c0_g1~~TRINITY_DN2791_c0_g1_i2.p1  ORF type:complete len:217 (+),score=30.72 TRINITY_DN2791_c0_g1_i2:147-797(+)
MSGIFELLKDIFSTKPIKEVDTKMSFPEYPQDNSKVGDIYLIGYNSGSSLTEETQEKRSHYSVVIDIAGESNNEEIIGLELHLGADERTRDTRPFVNRRIAEVGCLIFFHCLGKIENIGGHDLITWRYELEKEGIRIFHDLVNEHGGKWSSVTNCHSYAFLVFWRNSGDDSSIFFQMTRNTSLSSFLYRISTTGWKKGSCGNRTHASWSQTKDFTT